MNVVFERKFLKEISSISDRKLKEAVERAILNVENAAQLHDVTNIKKLKGEKDAYRIRVGDYRIGLYSYGRQIVFTRFLHRKEIYKYFP
jgi:mRNA interferase RelE/StbE